MPQKHSRVSTHSYSREREPSCTRLRTHSQNPTRESSIDTVVGRWSGQSHAKSPHSTHTPCSVVMITKGLFSATQKEGRGFCVVCERGVAEEACVQPQYLRFVNRLVTPVRFKSPIWTLDQFKRWSTGLRTLHRPRDSFSTILKRPRNSKSKMWSDAAKKCGRRPSTPRASRGRARC